jgi:uncharacterized protein YggE
MASLTRWAALACALVLSVAGEAPADALPDEPHVYVRGEHSIRVTPDLLGIRVRIWKTDADPDRAKADVDERSARLIAAAQDLGIASADLSATYLQVRPDYELDDETPRLIGTRVARRVEITLRDLSRYGELIRAIIAVRVGEVEDTWVESSQEADLQERCLRAAVEDARRRAAQLAEASGARLKWVYSVSQFETRHDDRERYRPFALRVASATGSADEPFEPGSLEISSRVYAVFLVSPRRR